MMPTVEEFKILLILAVVLIAVYLPIALIIHQEVLPMTRPVRLPQLPQSEKDRREKYRSKEQEIEDARYEAYLAKLNRGNGIGCGKK